MSAVPTPAQPRPRRLRLDRLAMLGLLLVYLALNLWLHGALGIRGAPDTSRYVSGAEQLLAGEPFTGKQSSYLGYILLLAVLKQTGSLSNAAIAANLALGMLSVSAVASMGRKIGGMWAGLVAALLLTVDASTSYWNFFVITDALFMSLVVVCLWLAMWARGRGVGRIALTVVVVGFTALARPNGWMLPPLIALFWILPDLRGFRRRLIAAGVVGIVCVGVALVSQKLQSGIAAEEPGQMLRKGEVVYNLADWRLPMPQDDQVTGSDSGAFIAYAVRHPLDTLRLAAARVLANFGNTRPIVSDAANLQNLLWLIPIYALALFGVWRFRFDPLVWLCVAIIAAQSLIVAVTFADLVGRFLAYILPVIYLLAAIGAAAIPAALTVRWRAGQAVAALSVAFCLVVAGVRLGAAWSPPLRALIGDQLLPEGIITRSDNFGGEIKLIGFRLPDKPPELGKHVKVTLVWEMVGEPSVDYAVSVQMVGKQDHIYANADATIASAGYPQWGTSVLKSGTRFSEVYDLMLAADSPPVLDWIVVVYDPATGQRLPLIDLEGASANQTQAHLTKVGILTAEGVPALPMPVRDVRYHIGSDLQVTGVSLPAVVDQGQTLEVGIRLLADKPILTDYVLFFHIVDSSGTVTAQSDTPVLNGDWTTSALIPGQPLGAIRSIDLKGAPPGVYQALMGLYTLPDVVRLPVTDAASMPVADGLISLGSFVVR